MISPTYLPIFQSQVAIPTAAQTTICVSSDSDVTSWLLEVVLSSTRKWLAVEEARRMHATMDASNEATRMECVIVWDVPIKMKY